MLDWLEIKNCIVLQSIDKVTICWHENNDYWMVITDDTLRQCIRKAVKATEESK